MLSVTQNSELNHNLPVKPPGAAIANRESRIMSRIVVDAGGAGLNPGTPRHAAGGAGLR